MSEVYRWLLRAYPAGYRRERGLEIVQTFLDAGRSRPSPREAINLVSHGMRARLGRPASRSVVLWASLFSLVCGLFVAAAAVRLAWETAKPLPSKAEAAEVFETVLPGGGLSGGIERSSAMFVLYGDPLGLNNFDTLFFGDGGEYQFGHTSSGLAHRSLPDPRQILPSARERLRANGWRVEETIVSDAVSCATSACDPTTLPKQFRVIAQRGDTILELDLSEASGPNPTYVHAQLQRATPWAAHPAGALGGLFGALAGWLVFGWASRRTDTAPVVVRAAVNGFFSITLFLWGAPIPPSAFWAVDHHLREPHPSWHPLWEWLGQPFASLLFLVGCAAGLLGLALAALPYRRPEVTEVRSI